MEKFYHRGHGEGTENRRKEFKNTEFGRKRLKNDEEFEG